MPKIRCRRKKHGPSSIHGDDEEADGEALDSEDEDEQEQSKARVLWIRNITRIQRQVCHVAQLMHTMSLHQLSQSKEKHKIHCCPGVVISTILCVVTGFLLLLALLA